MTHETYPKLSGPFKRDPQTAKIDRTRWSSPELELLADLPIWNFTEKLDGTNVRVFWDGYRVSWFGRTDAATFSSKQDQALRRHFYGPDNEVLFEQVFGPKPAILFGELYGAGVQSGGIYRDDIEFSLFDAKVEGFWLHRDNVEDVAKNLGLEVVPLYSAGWSLTSAIHTVELGVVSQATADNKPDTLAEGLVGFTDLGLQNRRGERIGVKVKTRDLKEN